MSSLQKMTRKQRQFSSIAWWGGRPRLRGSPGPAAEYYRKASVAARRSSLQVFKGNPQSLLAGKQLGEHNGDGLRGFRRRSAQPLYQP